VIEHWPGWFAHGTCELQAALVNEHVPIDEQSDELRQATVASLAHWPMISGHVPGFTEQTAPGGLLHVPFLVQVASAAAWVAPLQTFPGAAPQLPPTALQSEFFVQTVTPSLQ
jgi:hypothetical protein